MILRYIEISIAHSTAISGLADRIEFEARLGRRINDVLHLHFRVGGGAMGCFHIGRQQWDLVYSCGVRISEFLKSTYPTPFGLCNSRDVAAELMLRQILAREALQAARARGKDMPYLHVWE